MSNFDLIPKALKQKRVEEVLIRIDRNERKDWTKTNIRIFKNFLSRLSDRYSLGIKLKEVRMLIYSHDLRSWGSG